MISIKLDQFKAFSQHFCYLHPALIEQSAPIVYATKRVAHHADLRGLLGSSKVN